MLSVTSTPTSAEMAGTRPSPYLVIERENAGRQFHASGVEAARVGILRSKKKMILNKISK